MALIVLTWDLPAGDRMGAYVERARNQWIPSILSQQGFKEFRAYRNPHRSSPQVMGQIEFDSLESVESYIESMAYATITAGLTSLGCANVVAQVWDTSPVVPEPLGPPTGG